MSDYRITSKQLSDLKEIAKKLSAENVGGSIIALEKIVEEIEKQHKYGEILYSSAGGRYFPSDKFDRHNLMAIKKASFQAKDVAHEIKALLVSGNYFQVQIIDLNRNVKYERKLYKHGRRKR